MQATDRIVPHAAVDALQEIAALLLVAPPVPEPAVVLPAD